MTDYDPIPMPSKAEREASIQTILDSSLSPARFFCLPLSALVFGVEDCLFLAVLLGLLPLGFVFTPTETLADCLAAILFLSSPLLYAAACALTMWKEALCGTLDWKRTCRLPLQTLMALRMLLFGGIALLVCVPMNLLLWQSSGHAMPLSRMMAVSFSSLFLYAALSLTCRKLRRGAAVPAAVWVVLGMVLLVYEPSGRLLSEVPTAIFFFLAGGGLAYCLTWLRTMLRYPNKGGSMYAFR